MLGSLEYSKYTEHNHIVTNYKITNIIIFFFFFFNLKNKHFLILTRDQ